MTDQSRRAVKVDELATALRVLAMDAVEHAGAGHPGMPMGMADIAVALWHDHLRHNPADPSWPDRDRFVLSNGHGSLLLYNLLHLSGYGVSIDDLRSTRRFGSRTPGHPEYRLTPGVETTTGPLGQGLANAVGMALAERLLAARFNRPGHAVVDHFTYAFVGDGCLMEGISHEVCSLAGALGLGKLIVLYDDNGVSIDGPVAGWFADDTPRRFEAYGWQVFAGIDGHDIAAVSAAIAAARQDTARPSLICCKTLIGKGSATMAGSKECHGAPLGAQEVARSREALGWLHPPFVIPPEIRAAWSAEDSGKALQKDWEQRFAAYAAAFPAEAAEFQRRIAGDLPGGFPALVHETVQSLANASKPLSGRQASHDVVSQLAPHLPELIGGSADLSVSTMAVWPAAKPVTAEGDGNFISYGVREFGMAAMINGMLCHGGFRPFAGTYLVFSDYARNALRMAALMGLGAIHVLTHDSIAVGGDGPTHQPAEHLASLRLIPNLDLWRPCDGVETAIAWAVALEQRDMPTVLALSRQAMRTKLRKSLQMHEIRRGGYVLSAEAGRLDVILIATGSEVDLALAAQEELKQEGLHVRVVSMPSTRSFDRQDQVWKQQVLPPGPPRLAIEAGVSDYWRKYVGLDGDVIGVDGFGHSAPPDELFRHFGLTLEAVTAAVRRLARS